MSSSDGSSVIFRHRSDDVRSLATARFARKLEREVAKGSAFDVLLTGDAELRRLNRDFRGKDYATDVLSFVSGQAPATVPRAPRSARVRAARRIGDIAISVSTARAQARSCGHSTEKEVRILMLHGLLHLLGMDHETDGGRMARAEKRWRVKLGLPNGLLERVER
jgi:probable rRNA maturation factor